MRSLSVHLLSTGHCSLALEVGKAKATENSMARATKADGKRDLDADQAMVYPIPHPSRIWNEKSSPSLVP